MNSWTRTLNLDDTHTLMALATPGQALDAWADACHEALPELSMARRRELIRMLRDGFMDVDDDGMLGESLFFEFYQASSALAQIDLVQVQWTLSHPLSLIAVEELVQPALGVGELDIPLDDVEALVAEHLSTSSAESRRKTRTVLLGALEGTGVLATSGTGQHRSLRASRGAPHPTAFAYLIHRELGDRDIDAMLEPEVLESSLPVRLTQCGTAHARACLDQALGAGLLVRRDDEIALGAV